MNQFLLVIVSLFFGILGVDRLLLGCYFTGLLKAVTLGGFGLWWLRDLVYVAGGSRLCKEKDKQ